MLVDKKKTTTRSYIAAIKLVSGEEIMARVTPEGRDYRLRDALSLVMTDNPNDPSTPRVMFTPWIVAGGDDAIILSAGHILAITKARKDAADQYATATSKDPAA